MSASQPSSFQGTNEASAARLRFVALSSRLEAEAKRDPKSYNRRVALLAALGYGYIFAVLVVFLLLLGALVAIVLLGHVFNTGLLKIGLVIGVLALVTLRSLWVRIAPPEGRELSRAEAPQLFADVDEIGAKLKAPAPHHVLLCDDFNAAVAQVPRWGLFGRGRSYLLVGLPLMAALSPQEFKSVLAHEFGHLSDDHGRFGAWIYRVRQTWANLLESFENGHNWIFSPFFNWYAPYFGAYSFVLARRHEYIADACAAQVCGARTCADALTRSEVAGQLLQERVWPSIWKRAASEAQPPRDVLHTLGSAVGAPLEEEVARRFLTAAVSRPADETDTHPSLSQRLAALEEEPRLLPPASPNAAQFYLGDRLAPLSQELQGDWSQNVAPFWEHIHQGHAQNREELELLQSKTAPLSDDEQWALAEATESNGDEDAALDLFQRFLAAHPDQPRAQFAVGRLLLERGDEAGLEFLERACGGGFEQTDWACGLAENFLLGRGQTEESRVWRERGLSFGDVASLAQAERGALSPKNVFLPHGLSDDQVKALRDHFARVDEVAEVLVVRKQVQHLSGTPFFVIGILIQKKITLGQEEQRRLKAFEAAINDLAFPGDFDCVFLRLDASDNFSPSFHKPLKKVPGSLVYARPR